VVGSDVALGRKSGGERKCSCPYAILLHVPAGEMARYRRHVDTVDV
jgi:hypothetical protein